MKLKDSTKSSMERPTIAMPSIAKPSMARSVKKESISKSSIAKEKLTYLKYSIFHPFDGFYEIKHREKGSVAIATLLFALYGIMRCISYQYTGFIMNRNAIFSMNSISIFISSVSVFLLFIVSNWTITTLFNGKGSMGDIYILTGYSLVPLLLSTGVVTFVSNFIILEELPILLAVQVFGVIWFVFLMLAGLCVIHEYSMGVNLKTLIATAIAAAILVFLGILFFTLLERMYSFVASVIQEAIRRIY